MSRGFGIGSSSNSVNISEGACAAGSIGVGASRELYPFLMHISGYKWSNIETNSLLLLYDKFSGVAKIHIIVGVEVGVGGTGVEVCASVGASGIGAEIFVGVIVLVETGIVLGAHATKINAIYKTAIVTYFIFISWLLHIFHR